MLHFSKAFSSFATIVVLAACAGGEVPAPAPVDDPGDAASKYVTVRLTADLGGLSEAQRTMLRLFIDACEKMDDAFWLQAYGDKQELLASIADPALRRLAEINYGPWDRLEANQPFIEGVGPKPPGASFYPADMSKEEFETALSTSDARASELKSLYTVVRRDEHGALITRPYHEEYRALLEPAAARLREAAALATDPGLRRYLELRARGLLTDDYRPSDMAWMDMKHNAIDVVIGPIESYEDQLFGYKTAFEGYVLIKDSDWSARLERYAKMLPDLQRALPVPDRYKQESPGSSSDLNAYDVVYYAGDCNAGSKTIAINLPNDEEVQLRKGTRRLQLKNAMRAKFDDILLPIARMLIAEDQMGHITFDAFFNNTMFHEVAHGLGIKNTLDGRGTVRAALLEQASAVEEGKADILGLYMVTRLDELGELEGALEDHYVTFMASVFRSIRFGATSAHGRANLARFNFLEAQGAFKREASGRYRVDLDRLRNGMSALSEKLLRLQGDGDYRAAADFMTEMGRIGPDLDADLGRLSAAGIPVDVVFEQGPDVLGL